jgi:MFS family permease
MPSSRQRSAIVLLCAAHAALVLDVTVVNVALPAAAEDLGLEPGALHWVVSAYALAFGGALLVGGRIGDRIGYRVALSIGIGVFAVASLACALAPTHGALVASRVLQGLGAALADPAALGLLASMFPAGPQRTRALAAWASTTALAAVAGLAAGGMLTQLLSWRWVFLVTVPLGVVVPLSAVILLPRRGSGRTVSFDGTSALVGSAGIVTVIAALSTASGPGGVTAGTAMLGLIGVGLVGWFIRRERRSSRPLVPRALIASGAHVATLVVAAVGGALVLGSFFLLPIALSGEPGLTPIQTGAVLLASRVPAIGWSRLVRRLIDTVGAPVTATAGMVLFVVAELSFTRLGDGGGTVAAVLGIVALGLAIPCVFMAASSGVLAATSPEAAGAGAAVLTTAQWLGGAAGLALVTLGTNAGTQGDRSTSAGFWVCVALAGIGAIAASNSGRGRPVGAEAHAPA